MCIRLVMFLFDSILRFECVSTNDNNSAHWNIHHLDKHIKSDFMYIFHILFFVYERNAFGDLQVNRFLSNQEPGNSMLSNTKMPFCPLNWSKKQFFFLSISVIFINRTAEKESENGFGTFCHIIFMISNNTNW